MLMVTNQMTAVLYTVQQTGCPIDTCVHVLVVHNVHVSYYVYTVLIYIQVLFCGHAVFTTRCTLPLSPHHLLNPLLPKCTPSLLSRSFTTTQSTTLWRSERSMNQTMVVTHSPSCFADRSCQGTEKVYPVSDAPH